MSLARARTCQPAVLRFHLLPYCAGGSRVESLNSINTLLKRLHTHELLGPMFLVLECLVHKYNNNVKFLILKSADKNMRMSHNKQEVVPHELATAATKREAELSSLRARTREVKEPPHE